MSGTNFSLKPGQINLDLIPIEWPLTPLGNKKDAYLPGWSRNPCDKNKIAFEIETEKCKAVGVIGGPVYNQPYGLVWLDVDGPSVYPLIEKISQKSFDEALSPTLTIQSGKEGRERRLYIIKKENWEHLIRNKYVWYSENNKEEKLELLWSHHQGVLMGAHPETDGYYTKENLGFEWVPKLPELPAWIIDSIKEKNKKQSKPATEIRRTVGANFAFNAEIGLERDKQLATEAMWSLPLESVDDYDIWIMIGQVLHGIDESLLNEWDEWSKQSDKYKENECLNRWRSFDRDGGRTIGSLLHVAKEYGWAPSQDYRVENVDDAMLEQLAKQHALMEQEELTVVPGNSTINTNHNPVNAMPKTTLYKTPIQTKQTNDKQEKKSRRNPSINTIADVIVAHYNGNLVYSRPHGKFFIYSFSSLGLWEDLSELEMLGLIEGLFRSNIIDLPNGYNVNLLNETYKLLQVLLPFDDWHDGSDYLLFKNGILDVNTKELKHFDRDLYINQQLPYDYDPNADCPLIKEWLLNTQWKSKDRLQVLRAWLRATLMSAYDLQKFIEIIGPGKSGKSTYANLCVALVGKDNIHATDFENLEKGRFEAGAYYGKKLILLQDQDRWGGSVAKLKAITGGDWIRPERKYEKELDAFQYHGLVIITANEAIQSTDYTSGLGRRRLTIPFDRPFIGNSSEQRELIKFDIKGNAGGEFAAELPGLVNWLLQMSNQEMREYLIETTDKVKEFKKFEMEQRVSSNPVLDWMESNIVWDRGAISELGIKRMTAPGASRRYMASERNLYPSYCEHCDNAGVNAVGRKRFEQLVIDIIRHQLKLPIVVKRHSGRSPLFIHVAVKASNPTRYVDFPSIIGFSQDKVAQAEIMKDLEP